MKFFRTETRFHKVFVKHPAHSQFNDNRTYQRALNMLLNLIFYAVFCCIFRQKRLVFFKNGNPGFAQFFGQFF